MLYLASQFVWFLLAAFSLGFVMGWISQNGAKLELRSSKLALAAGVWLLAGAVSWTQAVNGLPALWLETALLFMAVYFAGCALASVMRAATQPKALAQAALGLEGMPTPDSAAAALAGGGPDADERAAAMAATARDAAPRIEQAKNAANEGKAILDEAGSAGETVKTLLKVDGEDAIPGQRPAGLPAARAETPDDLKLIKGIGRQNEGRLHGLGIWHFDQIAAWTPENIEWVGGYLAFPGRIEREDWVGQASALAAGAETEFARRARADEVASSRDDGLLGQGNVAALKDGEFDGDKPGNLLSQARDGKPDELIWLKGVGPAVAADLNRLGIWHFDQIAVLKDAEIRYLCAFADVPVATSQSWREDADILRHGGDTAHSRSVKAGRKPTA
jgi:predicted flap endonuclease-1-like 5' DNA nuclease